MEEFRSQELPRKIGDLVIYHGEECIFGSSYWEGFAVSEHGEER
jgi:hypothetical protein